MGREIIVQIESFLWLNLTFAAVSDMKTQIGTNIDTAADILRAGSCVAIPTETVYGLAANGLDKEAVSKIFEAKERPAFDPLILHIAEMDAITALVTDFPDKAKRLADRFWPGPLTLILPKSAQVSDLVSAGLQTVGVRMPRHEMTRRLLGELDFPLAAPSANPFGYISPTTAQHVKNQLDGKIPYILDGGRCGVGVESTIVSFGGSEVKILRKGGVSIEAIEKVIGTVEVQTRSTSNPTAPGMLVSHYAPGKILIFGNIPELIQQHKNRKIAVIGFKSTYGEAGEILSPEGNLVEAAQNLFAILRKLDESDCELILAEELPDFGLGRAINDRLRRAATSQPPEFND